jgi:hypothetical protein
MLRTKAGSPSVGVLPGKGRGSGLDFIFNGLDFCFIFIDLLPARYSTCLELTFH